MNENKTKELDKVEHIKAESKKLRGTLEAELIDTETSGFSEESKNLIKFHGMYQQKNRDRLSDPELEENKPHTLMVRGRIPGGRLTSAQYIVWDDLATKFGNDSLRLTTRQSIQLYGILKTNIKETIATIYTTAHSTMGACGDVVRNVTQAVNPNKTNELAQLDEIATLLSDHFRFKTNAYAEIWLDAKQINTETEVEPIYGATYLPRKFKIAVTIAGNNGIDIYTNDLGLVATLDTNGIIDGYFVLAGGGLGMTHNKPETFPRAADLLGWIPKEHTITVAEAIVTAHRDWGDRTNRKHARLKYVLADKGVEWFRSEVEKRASVKLIQKELPAWDTPSYLGWNECNDGTLSFGFHLLSGRIVDTQSKPLKKILRQIIEQFQLNVQISPDQDLLLLNIKKEDKEKINEILQKENIDPTSPKPLYDRAISCVALPTCPLALTESERVFPTVLDGIQKIIEKHGLNSRAPIVRMTGCPNGCGRPYSAEIGIVGQQSGGKYALYLGGNPEGTIIATQVAQKLKIDEINERLEKLFVIWKKESNPQEKLGSFINRVGLDKIKTAL